MNGLAVMLLAGVCYRLSALSNVSAKRGLKNGFYNHVIEVFYPTYVNRKWT